MRRNIYKNQGRQHEHFLNAFFTNSQRPVVDCLTVVACILARSQGVYQRNRRESAICKKRFQKCGVSPCILINIFSYLLSDSYMQHYLQITICNKFRKMLRLIKKHTQGEMQKWKKDGTFTIRINN